MEKTKMEGKTNYGNWVPEKMLYLLLAGTVVFLAAAVIFGAVTGWKVAAVICGILGGIMLLYVSICIGVMNCLPLEKEI